MSVTRKSFFSVLAIFLSGLMIAWHLWVLPAGTPYGWYTVLHVLLNALFLPLVVMPFLVVHRKNIQVSSRPFMRKSGATSEVVFYSQLVIGLYLLLVGNQDGMQGIAQKLHFGLSVVLISIILMHVLTIKWIRLRRIGSV